MVMELFVLKNKLHVEIIHRINVIQHCQVKDVYGMQVNVEIKHVPMHQIIIHLIHIQNVIIMLIHVLY